MIVNRIYSQVALFTLLSLFFRLKGHVKCYEVETLTVSLYRVMKDGAMIDWHTTPEDKELKNCEFVYSPVADKEHQQITSDLTLERHTIDLQNLAFNVTYYFHMICIDNDNRNITSNTISFTTGFDKEEPMNYHLASPRQNPSVGGDSPYSVALDIERTHSSNVILGAICGIVGFVIINVTVVLAVRKYSHWQIRRRRIIDLEDHEYNGFEYLHNVD